MKSKNFVFFVMLLALIFGNILFAQDEELDNINFEESPLKEETPPYFAVAGGYTGTFLFTNFTDLNKALANNNFNLDKLKAPVYLSGGQGFVAIGLNLRVGFLAMGGSAITEKDFVIDIGIDTPWMVPHKRTVEYYASMAGLSVDYAFVPMKSISLAVVPGISFGLGEVRIESAQAPAKTNWLNFKPQGDIYTYLNRAESNFYFVQPNINIEYAPTSLSMFRLSAGYSASFMGDWKFNRNANLGDVPKGINASGLTVQFGIFLGLFNY